MLSQQHIEYVEIEKKPGKYKRVPFREEWEETPCAIHFDYATDEQDRAAIVGWIFRYGDETIVGKSADDFAEYILALKKHRNKEQGIMLKVISHDLDIIYMMLNAYMNCDLATGRGGKILSLTIEGFFRIQEIERLFGKKWYKGVGSSLIEKYYNKAEYYWNNNMARKTSSKEDAVNGTAPDTATQYIKARMKELMTREDKVLVREQLFPLEQKDYEYDMKYMYMGGMCGINPKVMDCPETYAYFDIKSSYISSILLEERYPMTKWKRCKDTSRLDEMLLNYCCKIRFRAKNIRCDIGAFLIEYRCEDVKGISAYNPDLPPESRVFYDDERVHFADELTTTLCDVDYQEFHKSYDYEDLEVLELWTAERGMLPKYVRDVAAEFFLNKESANKTERDFFKLCDQLTYGTCGQQLTDEQKKRKWWQIREQAFVSPYWAIYIAAFSRRNILEMIRKCDKDWLYSDTDSILPKNPGHHADDFITYNEKKQAQVQVMCEREGWDFDKFRYLGSFMAELKKDKTQITAPYLGMHFKTLAPKTYAMTWKDEETGKTKMKVVSAGCKQNYVKDGDFVNTWEYHYTPDDIFEVFNNVCKIEQKEEVRDPINEPYDVVINGTEYHCKCGAILKEIRFTENRVQTLVRSYEDFMARREEDFKKGYEVR